MRPPIRKDCFTKRSEILIHVLQNPSETKIGEVQFPVGHVYATSEIVVLLVACNEL